MNTSFIKKRALLLSCLLFIGSSTSSVELPGALFFYNGAARTRIGTVDGPYAGPGIWAQMLAGPTTDDLSLVGVPVEHLQWGGQVLGGVVIVPTVPCSSVGYVQMIAWDGSLWGLDPENVPPDQLGMTDTIRYAFGCPDIDPLGIPQFTQPAVVPIPEPSALSLVALGLGLPVTLKFRRARMR